MRPIIARARQLLFPDPARDLEIDRRRRCDLLDNALGFLPKARIIGLQIHDNAVSTQAEAADAGTIEKGLRRSPFDLGQVLCFSHYMTSVTPSAANTSLMWFAIV